MKKINLYILILIMLTTLAQATIVNKPLNVTIENCYSVGIEVDLEEGKETSIGFVGCTKVDTDEFHCDCLTKANKNFTIIMRTDNVMVRDIRYYDIDITARYFDVYRKTMSVDVEDGGEYYKNKTSKWRETDNNIKKLIQIKYINKTVYQDRIVEVPKETIVYKEIVVNNTIIKYVNRTEYVKNSTRLNELEKEIKSKNFLISVLYLSGFIILAAMIYIRIKK